MIPKHLSGKTALIAIALLVVAAAVFGYARQASTMKQADDLATNTSIDSALLAVRPSDMLVGDHNALVTLVEYSSLSCPHCAHFHKDVLPALEKEFISTGKVKLVIRHFPLNEPAMKASQLVECVGAQGGNRINFLKGLFDTQEKWAFSESYLMDLKKIALVGGVDSAAFDSCVADGNLEARILNSRKEAAEKLSVNATPTFFIDGVKLEGDYSADNFRKALKAAMK